MEQTQIIGNIGQDAVIKDFNGKQYGSFTVGVNFGYKNAEGVRVETTNWYNILTSQTSRVQWLKKGAKVFVQGRLKASIYTNKEDQSRISLDMAANLIDIVTFVKDEQKDENEANPANPPAPTPAPEVVNPQSDDLPF